MKEKIISEKSIDWYSENVERMNNVTLGKIPEVLCVYVPGLDRGISYEVFCNRCQWPVGS